MKKNTKRRLVGALGASGGSLVLSTMLSYYIFPEYWDWRMAWRMALSFEIIGIFLIIMAVFFYLKE